MSFLDIEPEKQDKSSVKLQNVPEIASFHHRNQKCLNFKDNPAAQTTPLMKEIMIHLASAIWHGGLKDGIGMISTESGVLKQTPYSVGTRFGGQPVTSPEELIAAAYAGCFSLALAAELDKAGLAQKHPHGGGFDDGAPGKTAGRSRRFTLT